MSRRADRLEALRHDSDRQRQALGAAVDGLRPAARLVSPLIRITAFMRRHPMLTALLSLAVTRTVRRHRWMRLAGGVTLLWRALSVLRRLLSGG